MERKYFGTDGIRGRVGEGFITPELKTAFNNLQDNDKIECINLLKKSIYYRNTAVALIEANQTAFDFCSILRNGKDI